ncbi:MAG: hypothetical protein R3F43_11090 [bacterium]
MPLARLKPAGAAVDVVHAAETIGMAEHPGRAARAKRQSSMHVGFGRLHRRKPAPSSRPATAAP